MKIGQLVVLNTHDYADKSFSGPFRVAKDFLFADIKPLVEALPPRLGRSKPGPDDFIQYLQTGGYIEKLPCEHVHLGNYNDIAIEAEPGSVDEKYINELNAEKWKKKRLKP